MSANDLRLEARELSKRYGRRWIFRALELSLSPGETLVITGHNGAGKSTLLRLLAGLEEPTTGSVSYVGAHATKRAAAARDLIGLVAPDIRVYGELTGVEHLELFSALRGTPNSRAEHLRLLEQVGLGGRGDDYAGSYSSGMALRLKYALAVQHRPPVLLLDEPTATLDAEGRALVEELVTAQRAHGITIIATNDPRELDLGDYRLALDDGRRGTS